MLTPEEQNEYERQQWEELERLKAWADAQIQQVQTMWFNDVTIPARPLSPQPEIEDPDDPLRARKYGVKYHYSYITSDNDIAQFQLNNYEQGFRANARKYIDPRWFSDSY